MAVYNVFLNILEVSILSIFIYVYYSFTNKKIFCLLFLSLFSICEICDILRQNGVELMILYFVVAYIFILLKKRKVLFGDVFLLVVYLFLLYITIIFSFNIYHLYIFDVNSIIFTVLVGITSKVLLVLITYIFIKYFKYQIIIPNSQYRFVILTETMILIIFIIVGYSTIDAQRVYNPFAVCLLLVGAFVFVIINAVYFNDVYKDKLNLEKQIQKEKFIQQGLFLIENVNYDINRKEHQLYWILEKIKQLNHDENKEITTQINQFQTQLQKKRMRIYSKNLVFDTVITMKINELIIRNITIKPLLEIESHEKYNDLEFVNTISEILDYILNDRDVTLHIRNHGMYILVELYSLYEFYDYDNAIYQSDLIIDKSKTFKNDIYYVRFLLRGQDEIIREKL